MTRDSIINEYFEWLSDHVRDKKHLKYRKLLMLLHNTEFRYSILMDSNREEDGIDLRYRFSNEIGYPGNYQEIHGYLDGPCSVLEMMIALAIRCEDIMEDPDIGDRVPHWFWLMIKNLGLERMKDDVFDKDLANEKISIFLDRKYKRNGEGGLFIVRNARRDLRKVEIWYQLCWYLDSII